ncbi:unnamed protein product [Moneuplotes crassus]|uniref:Lysozyme n=1 Tax=Euplotes crassus TaxID=5936 RepID=A0AAD1XYL8_EUPCR|nr:unnamed protein product [Moneuplotes crassus]
MEKIAIAILIIGAALLAYQPTIDYLSEKFPETLGNCRCDSVRDMVAWAEGNKLCMYRDSLGIPTIGIGFNLQRGDARKLVTNVGANFDRVLAGSECLTQVQVNNLFNNDLVWAKRGAQNCISGFSGLHNCIQNVVIDMTFNMGERSLCGWPIFAGQLSRKENVAAANNMKGTRWCGQVGRRCTRNTDLVRNC